MHKELYLNLSLNLFSWFYAVTFTVSCLEGDLQR